MKNWISFFGLVLSFFGGFLLAEKKENNPSNKESSPQKNQKKTNSSEIIFEKKNISQDQKDSDIALPKYWHSFFKRNPISILALVLTGVFMVFSPYFKPYSYWFKSDFLNYQRTQFDGSTLPIKKVPIWTEVSLQEREKNYTAIASNKFMDLPKYNINDFQKGKVWKPNNERERNAYVTYPVPNLGNYKLDGTENSGSHTGLDIKTPIGTPVHSIANGVVYKTGYQSYGFGYFVSIIHTNVPDPENPGKKTTLFSNYAHLSKIIAKEGDLVKKDQIIAESGNSGTATTPHLHFQIDRDNAPFHPYWPFGWKDLKKAGVTSFFEGVKQGVGKNNAQKYTINPMTFIYKNQSFQPDKNLKIAKNTNPINQKKSSAPKVPEKIVEKIIIVSPPKTEKKPKKIAKIQKPKIQKTLKNKKNEDSKKVKSNKEKEKTQEKQKTIAEKTRSRDIKRAQNYVPSSVQKFRRGQTEIYFETDKNFITGAKEKIKIHANAIALAKNRKIEIKTTLKNKAKISKNILSQKDFKNGFAEIEVTAYSPYAFRLIAKSDFGEIKSSLIKPEVFADVSGNYLYADAIAFYKKRKVVKGYATGDFKPEKALNRAEALKIILEANDIRIKSGKIQFPDVRKNAWYEKYVFTAVEKGIISGYKDGTFRPRDTVTRAEFLKISILAAGFNPSKVTKSAYRDVNIDKWYAKYFRFSKDYNLLRSQGQNFIGPEVSILRGEAIDVIYRLGRINRRT